MASPSLSIESSRSGVGGDGANYHDDFGNLSPLASPAHPAYPSKNSSMSMSQSRGPQSKSTGENRDVCGTGEADHGSNLRRGDNRIVRRPKYARKW
jgi:hypothetical protein